MGYTPHVLVVGGGAVGTGIARDLAIRGLDVTLVERDTLASGTTGRMNALLASGAQLAETDPRMASYCFEENRTLIEIASHCIEETDGLLVQDGGDKAEFERLRDACEECGLPVTPLSGEQARQYEPALAESVERALLIPDAAIDPFRLAVANARDALAYGADIRPHTEVTDVHVEDGAIAGVDVRYDPRPDSGEATHEETSPGTDSDRNPKADEEGEESEDEEEADEETEDEEEADEETEDEEEADEADDEVAEDEEAEEDADDETESRSQADAPVPRKRPVRLPEKTTRGEIPGESADLVTAARDLEVKEETIDADYIVNATGANADRITSMADLSVPLERTHELLAVGSGRPVETAVTVAAPGTQPAETGSIVPFGTNCVFGTGNRASDGKDRTVDTLRDSLSDIVPDIADWRCLRTFHRTRYSLSTHDRPAEHGHEFVLIDHAKHHDCWGMTTVLGGSVTTHRLAAEHAADEVCRKFGITRECQTDTLPLPGSDDDSFTDEVDPETAFGCSASTFEQSERRLGSRTGTVLSTDGVNPVVCECQAVTRAEIQDALEDETGTDVDLEEVRIRTSATMGECQGGRCAHRLAASLHPRHAPETTAIAGLDLLAGRWRGQCVSGPQLAQLSRTYRRYASTLNFKYASADTAAGFDFDGFDFEEFDFDDFDEGHRQQRSDSRDDTRYYCPRPGGVR